MVGKGKVLFLTNNENTNDAYEKLCALEGKDNVIRFTNKLTPEIVKDLEPSFVVSFNYKHIVKADVIDCLKGKIINLHVSYLPYNKGASPNFFSFMENTPKGVTIHKLEAGLDSGDILLQKELKFDESKETFKTSYDKLINEITSLLIDNWKDLKDGKIASKTQTEGGSYHKMSDLESYNKISPIDWNDTIIKAKEKYQK
ncbi:MAG: formyl transferase [Lachnospiraceae bacterium]|nr:formyl transferase [Lachnospiraceae bacterium]